MNVGRLHCLYPWWKDATVNFMNSGGYNVSALIKKVKQKTLIIWGEDDQIISNKLAVRLHCELPDAVIRQIPDCGHLPHVEKPNSAAKLILDFVGEDSNKEAQSVFSGLNPVTISSKFCKLGSNWKRSFFNCNELKKTQSLFYYAIQNDKFDSQ
ncbi:hypothetical protein OIU78_005158 [Salix suchowensis]|nr:hypothetical protein OIU78_005158 [Salix suchowensis]